MKALASDINSINAQISKCFTDEEINFLALRQLVEDREQLVTAYLSTLEGENKKLFAEKELAFNQEVESKVAVFFEQSRIELSQSITSRKLAAKYK